MSLRLRTVVLDCADPERLAAFWCAALGYVVIDRDVDGVGIGPGPGHPDAAGLAAGPVAPTIDLLVVPEPKAVKDRVHLDLVPAAGATRDEEVDRLLGLGATRVDVGQPPDASWVVLADPEGHEFCVLTPATPS